MHIHVPGAAAQCTFAARGTDRGEAKGHRSEGREVKSAGYPIGVRFQSCHRLSGSRVATGRPMQARSRRRLRLIFAVNVAECGGVGRATCCSKRRPLERGGPCGARGRVHVRGGQNSGILPARRAKRGHNHFKRSGRHPPGWRPRSCIQADLPPRSLRSQGRRRRQETGSLEFCRAHRCCSHPAAEEKVCRFHLVAF